MLKLICVLIAATCLFAAPMAQARTITLHEHINAIISGSEAGLVDARQRVPYFGIEAIPLLIPIIDHDNEAVWRTARNILADIVNESAKAGRDDEALAVTRALMAMTAPGRSDRARDEALRLIPIITPEGFDVAPVAVLLKDEQWREKARACLQEIGTSQARQALEYALEWAEPGFAVAVLRALERLADRESVPVIRPRLGHRAPEVRVAAMHALAWTGDPTLQGAYRDTIKNVDQSLVFDAWEAWLMLADGIVLQGGNWSSAISAYREALDSAQDPVIRGAAIAGLGRHGDETVVVDIVNALNSAPDESLDGPAIAALHSLYGQAAETAIEAHYAQFPDRIETGLIAALGAKRSSRFLGLLEDALSRDDERIRLAAFDALCDARLPESSAALLSFAQSAPDEKRRHVAFRMSQLAEHYRRHGQTEATGRAFLAVYHVARTDEDRRFALDGIKAYPAPEAFDVVMNAMDTDDLASLPVATLAGVVKALQDTGRHDDAAGLRDAMMTRVNSTSAVRDILSVPGILGNPQQTAAALGFVTQWMVIGPFPWNVGDGFWETPAAAEPLISTSEPYLPIASGAPDGVLDLHGHFAARQQPTDHVSAYAVSRITVPAAIEAIAWIGSDDGVKLWVNGDAVHEHNLDRGLSMDQDRAAIALKEGLNELQVQVTQGLGGWAFCVRLTDSEGTPLAFEMATEASE